jgi:hypothetical protein
MLTSTGAAGDITGDAATARSSAGTVTGDALRVAMTGRAEAGDGLADAVGPAMGEARVTGTCAAAGEGARWGLAAEAGDWLYWKCAMGDAIGTEEAGLCAVDATEAAAGEARAVPGVF